MIGDHFTNTSGQGGGTGDTSSANSKPQQQAQAQSPLLHNPYRMEHPRDSAASNRISTNKSQRMSNRAARNLAADSDEFGSMIMLSGRDTVNQTREEESKGVVRPSSSQGNGSGRDSDHRLISQRSAGMLLATPTTGSMM